MSVSQVVAPVTLARELGIGTKRVEEFRDCCMKGWKASKSMVRSAAQDPSSEDARHFHRNLIEPMGPLLATSKACIMLRGLILAKYPHLRWPRNSESG